MESDPEPVHLRAIEQALEAALHAIGQPLVDASMAAHEIAYLDSPGDDRDAEHDHLLWLGAVTARLGELCTPKLRVLSAIVDALADVAEPGETGSAHNVKH